MIFYPVTKPRYREPRRPLLWARISLLLLSFSRKSVACGASKIEVATEIEREIGKQHPCLPACPSLRTTSTAVRNARSVPHIPDPIFNITREKSWCGANKVLSHVTGRGRDLITFKVARWQNWIPSFPCAPTPSTVAQSNGYGVAIVLQARRAKHIPSKNLAIAIWQPW